MNRIARPASDEYPSFHAPYVAAVTGDDALQHMVAEAEAMQKSLAALGEEGAHHRYAPGKWTIKQVVGHMLDGERTFSYRALVFARGDAGRLPAMDQEAWMAAADFDHRTFAQLVNELRHLRLATIAMFDGLPPAALDRTGHAGDFRFTVRGLVWITAGHAAHHMNVLRQRYGVA